MILFGLGLIVGTFAGAWTVALCAAYGQNIRDERIATLERTLESNGIYL